MKCVYTLGEEVTNLWVNCSGTNRSLFWHEKLPYGPICPWNILSTFPLHRMRSHLEWELPRWQLAQHLPPAFWPYLWAQNVIILRLRPYLSESWHVPILWQVASFNSIIKPFKCPIITPFRCPWLHLLSALLGCLLPVDSTLTLSP